MDVEIQELSITREPPSSPYVCLPKSFVSLTLSSPSIMILFFFSKPVSLFSGAPVSSELALFQVLQKPMVYIHGSSPLAGLTGSAIAEDEARA